MLDRFIQISSVLLILIVAAIFAQAVIAENASQPGTIVVVVPPEEVIRESGLMVAKEVTGAVTIKLNGKTYTGYLTFPDTKVRRVGVKHMRVDQCIATGEIK